MMRSYTFASWLWKVPASGLVHAFGTVLGGILVTAAGVEMPRTPGGVDPATQALLIVPGGIAFALGLAALASRLGGRWWERWIALGAFLFVINGVGNAFESSIFTTLGGELGAALVNLPGSVLCALAVVLLFPAPSESRLSEELAALFSSWRTPAMARRLGLAILAFPVVYFAFGMLVAPIVTPHYAVLEFLRIPPLTTILQVLFLRSVLLLAVSLPILAGWRGTRRGLVAALGIGHFTTVGLGGLIQAPFFPAVLRWVHGVEILADSLVYAWLLVLLLGPAAHAAGLRARQAEDHAVPSPALR